MDSQCVSILPRVCGVLLVSGSSLPDDTSLEKLLDWFTTIAQTGTSLLEACPCLVDFVSKVAFDYTSGSSILSFTLKLTGLIGASEDGFKVLKVQLKNPNSPQPGLWEDPCLRIGWIQGLKMILKHSEALSFFAQADLIEPLLQLQTDSSLFVASAANQTLAQVLVLCQSPSSVGHNGSKNRDLEHNSLSMESTQNYSGIITKVSDYLNKSVVLKEISQLPGSQQILRLLAMLLEHQLSLFHVETVILGSVPPQASDCLPCPQRLIVTAILLLLRLCCVDSSSSSAGCVEVVRFITGNSKVQKCALEALLVLSKSPGKTLTLPNTAKHPTSLPCHSVFKLVGDLTGKAATGRYSSWIWPCVTGSMCRQIGSPLSSLLGFIQAVRKRACDTRWEARDSTVEFLGHLVGAPSCWAFTEQEMEPSDVLLGGRSFTVPLLKEALQDPESYVRASSISALAQTLTPSWQDGTALTQEQVGRNNILFQDSEGFARRAAVKYFIAWFSACSSPSSCWLLMQSVPTVLSQGVADLDWEVKLHTLELAELVLDRAFSDPSPSHPYAVMSDQDHRLPIAGQQSDLLSSLKNLVDWGVVSALLCGVVDCDRPVALKACQLLLKLRGIVCPEMGKDTCVVSEACSEADKEGICASVDPECVSVCEVLRVLDLDEKLSILTQSSDHIYNSPLSLLQDILTAAAASSPPGQDPRQELVMDCY
uniref:BRCA1-associated ATM activator 1 n=1 Tax=Poecilia mexicana TaxID=48701 RepID=A0A3B3YQ05_9TELE